MKTFQGTLYTLLFEKGKSLGHISGSITIKSLVEPTMLMRMYRHSFFPQNPGKRSLKSNLDSFRNILPSILLPIIKEQ